jgi:hypothetical protein
LFYLLSGEKGLKWYIYKDGEGSYEAFRKAEKQENPMW